MSRLFPPSYRLQAEKEFPEHVKWLKERFAAAVRMQDSEILQSCTSELSSALSSRTDAFRPEDRSFFASALVAAFGESLGPDTDLRCLDALVALLRHKKRSALPGLVIHWRPLLEKLVRLHFPKQRVAALTNRHTHGEAMVAFVREASRFFPPGSSREILAELRPMLCPHSGVVFVAQGLLATFLPTDDPEAARCSWLDEVFAMWPWLENTVEWNALWLDLLSRLARDSAGFVDWSPHVHAVFTAALRLLDLPVGSGHFVAAPRNEAVTDVKIFFDSAETKELTLVSRAARLLVFMLEPSGRSLRLLANLFRFIEPFYHPSNGGNWSDRLATFLKSLCSQFSKRVGLEREGKIPESFRLSKESIRCFVEMAIPIICKAQYSKSETVSISAIRSATCLAYVDPEATIPPLLQTVFPALETLTETHQTCSALQMLGSIARPLVWRAHYPEGVTHLSRLLYAALPGIDINDIVKAASAMRFFIGESFPPFFASSSPVSAKEFIFRGVPMRRNHRLDIGVHAGRIGSAIGHSCVASDRPDGRLGLPPLRPDIRDLRGPV